MGKMVWGSERPELSYSRLLRLRQGESVTGRASAVWKDGEESVLGDDSLVWKVVRSVLHFSTFLWDLHRKSIWKVGNHEEDELLLKFVFFLLLSFFISIL